MKVKFNAGFTVDNKQYTPGEHDVPQSVFDIASKLDTTGLPLIANTNQDPLCVKVENAKPEIQK